MIGRGEGVPPGPPAYESYRHYPPSATVLPRTLLQRLEDHGVRPVTAPYPKASGPFMITRRMAGLE